MSQLCRPFTQIFPWLVLAVLILSLASCDVINNTECPIPIVNYTPRPIPPGNYQLRWVDQHPREITLPIIGNTCTYVEFASVGDSLPSGTVLVLYLHKDRSIGDANAAIANATNPQVWTSTPGLESDWLNSRFRTSDWGKNLGGGISFTGVLNGEDLDNRISVSYFAYPIVAVSEPTSSTPEGAPIYRFPISLSNALGCTEWRDTNGQKSPLECREDFGVAILGQDVWLPAQKTEGGRLAFDSDSGGLSTANAWVRLRTSFTDNETGLPSEYEIAFLQAAIRMRSDGVPKFTTDVQCPHNLPVFNSEMGVSVATCSSSSMSQPGAALSWRSKSLGPLIGTQVRLLMGPVWTIYQEKWQELGLPTDQLRPIGQYKAVQHFSNCYRIVNDISNGGHKAYVQRRPYEWMRIPNLCIDTIGSYTGSRSNSEDKLWETVSQDYGPLPNTRVPPGDILDSRIIPLGGIMSPLSLMDVLAITLGLLIIIYSVETSQRQESHANANSGYCLFVVIGIVITVIVGVQLVRNGVFWGYSNPMQDRAPLASDILEKNDVGRERSLIIPNDLMGKIAQIGLAWDNRFRTIKQGVNAGDNEAESQYISSLLIGFGLGSFLAPVWLGMVLAGNLGGWIGLILQAYISLRLGLEKIRRRR